MAKSNQQHMDLAMAEELGLTLSPFVLTLDHVCQLNSQYGGFHFGFQLAAQVYYDTAELKTHHLGLRIKPARFLLPTSVGQRLRDKHYKRWYFYDRDYLYPLQSKKPTALFDRFWFVEHDDCHYRSRVIVNPDKFQLRKKPIVGVRPAVITWDDCTKLPPRPCKSTQPVRCVDYA